MDDDQLIPFENDPNDVGESDDEEEGEEVEGDSETSSSSDDPVELDAEERKRRKLMGARGSRNGGNENVDGEEGGGEGNSDEPGTSHGNNNAQRKVTFNRSLPATHSYLGDDLEEVGAGNRGVFEDNTIVDGIPLFPVPNLILMPGQTFPLHSLHPRAISMFRNIIARSQLFGVITVTHSLRPPQDFEAMSRLGTLTQVVAFKEATDHEITSIKVRAVGRERFEIVETQRQIDGTLIAKIKILPEITLGSPLASVELPCTSAMQAIGSKVSSRKSVASKRNSKYLASAFTPWPWFVYKQYDITDIIRQIKCELQDWYDPKRVEDLSKLPVDFSYWVAANLPLDNETKMRLLSINCALQRLRYELSLIKQFTILVCRGCATKIGQKSSLFSMSLEGIIGAFVNPHGYVHETITLTEAVGFAEVGHPTTENSWFPGYAWTIINCSLCHAHLGWKFSARRRHLKPEQFFGISRAAIMPSKEMNVVDEDEDENLPSM